MAKPLRMATVSASERAWFKATGKKHIGNLWEAKDLQS